MKLVAFWFGDYRIRQAFDLLTINVVRPLLTRLSFLTRQELAQQIRYRKAENEIPSVQVARSYDARPS